MSALFEGCGIRFEFSPSDLGSSDAEARADEYATLCAAALEERFPGAEIVVAQSQAPRTRVADPDGDHSPDLEEEVRWVTEQVFTDGQWWPDGE